MRRKFVTEAEANRAREQGHMWVKIRLSGPWTQSQVGWGHGDPIYKIKELGEPGWELSDWVISPIDPNNAFHVAGYLASQTSDSTKEK